MRLRQYLEERQMTASEFAARIGVSAWTVSRYCSGERTPRREVLARICKETKGKVTPNDFMEVEPA